MFPNLVTSIGNKNILFPNMIFILDTTQQIPQVFWECNNSSVLVQRNGSNLYKTLFFNRKSILLELFYFCLLGTSSSFLYLVCSESLNEWTHSQRCILIFAKMSPYMNLWNSESVQFWTFSWRQDDNRTRFVWSLHHCYHKNTVMLIIRKYLLFSNVNMSN